uniref:Variant surface glycoprotein 1125.1739 n=1 Tax=Trypanosoma brucei TaxID=5691 RepID=A0A1J0R7X4_9TRYP|nr:variant surface glycoprotein 1125.1739 [Trypanosoma brucei]
MRRNSGRTTSTLALALALKLLAVPVSPSGPAFDEEPVAKVCKVAKALADIEGVALSKINNLINQVSAANEAAAKVSLAAATTADTNTSTLYAAAAGIAARCSADAVTALATLAPIALNAAANGAKTSGHISEVIDILRQAGKGRSTSKCIVQNGVNTATAASTVTVYGCPADILEKPEQAETHEPDVVDAKGFKTLSVATNLHSSSATSSCIFLAGGNDAAAQLWKANSGPGSAVSIAQGFITITPHDTATQATAKIPQLNTLGDSWSATDTTTTAKLYNKIGDLAKHTHSSCGQNVDEVLEHILTQERLKEALLAIVKKPKGAPAKPTEDEIATSLINSVEPAGASQTQMLKEKVLNTMVLKLVEGSKTQVKLRTLTDPGEIQINTLAAIQELKTRVEPVVSTEICPQQFATNQAQEEFCNTIGDANKEKCNNNRQCSYDDTKETGKKCTYNASKETAKGVPATQPQTGGTEATTENCKGKLEPECTKLQECKWENNSFKDSSFTVNNKLAPIVYGFTSFVVF